MTHTILSHYRIVGELGRGGMGVLYKAEDLRLERTVAIKVLRPDRSLSEERRQRFRREAKAASALNHPNIVTIYEVERGRIDGEDHDCIVMEWIEGQPLDRLIESGPLELNRIFDVACGIADGLAAAHAAGIVHRDLKPANVMVTSRGDAKLVDFGLAKLVEVSSDAETKGGDLYTAEGAVLGTAAYMSPEQAAGHPVDQRSDIFSFGTLLYELLTRTRPFKGDSQISTRMAVLSHTPAPIRTLRPGAPVSLARIVERCLEKHPERRFISGTDLATDLRKAREAATRRPYISRRVLIAGASAAILIMAIGSWFGYRAWQRQSARYDVLPEVERLGDQGRMADAFTMLQTVGPVIGDDVEFQRLLTRLSAPVRLTTDPPGAAVSWRAYEGDDPAWLQAGITPVDLRLPAQFVQLRFQKEGFTPVEIAAPPLNQTVTLFPLSETPVDMVYVPGGAVTIDEESVRRPAFWLDKFEVTNRRYKAFVDAGGYRDPTYWKVPFQVEGKALTFRDAMARLTDKTGQPGPSTWESSSYPEGEADFPVRGISWYEAAALAEFEGKRLPTAWHWLAATYAFTPPVLMDLSNYRGTGPARVGAFRGLGFFGTHDMAGNVREWTWNATGQKRSNYGGGWNEVTYTYRSRYAYDPFDRSETNGVRLAKYLEPPPPQLLAPIERTWRNYAAERPVDDVTFAAYARLYEYDPKPIGATSEGVVAGTVDYTIERVSYDAGYGEERITADLYLPARGRPPFQAVVMFPGSSAQAGPRSTDRTPYFFDFIVKSGRALIFPTYNSTFERQLKQLPRRASLGHRDLVIQNVKEVRRTIDYLVSRPDIDAQKLAYYGFSWGAREGVNITAVERRFRASILMAGGFDNSRFAPEADQINFAPRVVVPTLMINGREDFRFPYEESQLPMFQALGSQEKVHHIIKSGHVPPRLEIVKPILDWLEKYLGPVNME